jgi:hypothetical protein
MISGVTSGAASATFSAFISVTLLPTFSCFSAYQMDISRTHADRWPTMMFSVTPAVHPHIRAYLHQADG